MADKNKADLGGGGGVDEAKAGAPLAGGDQELAIGTAGAEPVVHRDVETESDGDDAPDPKVMTTSRFAKKHPTLQDPTLTKPNSPCFDYDPKNGKPRLQPTEVVVAEATKEGVHVVVTNHGRKIFCCKLDKYEAAFGVLVNRPLFERFFPDAK
jgi:hypothetical protein